MFLIRHNMPEGITDSTGWVNTQRRRRRCDGADAVRRDQLALVFRRGARRTVTSDLLRRCCWQRLLFVAMMFIATAMAVCLVASKGGIDPAAHAEVIDFGKFVVLAITETCAVRMAAVFMMSLATIWLKTGLMPRWLVAAAT